MNNKKLNLETLKVKSFVTTVDSSDKILSGMAASETDTPSTSSLQPTYDPYGDSCVNPTGGQPSNPVSVNCNSTNCNENTEATCHTTTTNHVNQY